MTEQSTQLTLVKETKNTYKFEEAGDGPPVCRNIYVEKWVFNGDPPEGVSVTVEALDE